MTLNVAALERVADWLERGAPHHEARGMHFDMRPQINMPTKDLGENWCGSACCIAGAVVSFEQPELVLKRAKEYLAEEATVRSDVPKAVHIEIWQDAVDLLGISDETARHLFAPFDNNSEEIPSSADESYWPWRADSITPKWAAATIRLLIATGEVRWDLTHPDHAKVSA